MVEVKIMEKMVDTKVFKTNRIFSIRKLSIFKHIVKISDYFLSIEDELTVDNVEKNEVCLNKNQLMRALGVL